MVIKVQTYDPNTAEIKEVELDMKRSIEEQNNLQLTTEESQ